MAIGSWAVDGGVVVKALLIAGLWCAGWGAARLVATVVPDAGLPGQFVAVTLAIWNPYVAERLLQGHWSLLVGYGCLPWVATAMLRLRAGDGGRVAAGVLDRVRGADADGAAAGRHASRWSAPSAPGPGRSRLAVRHAQPRGGGACGAAVARRLRALRFAFLDAGDGGARLRRPRRTGPRHASAASRGLAASGMARPYPIRGQRFSRWSAPPCCSRSSRAGLPTALRRPAAVPLLALAARRRGRSRRRWRRAPAWPRSRRWCARCPGSGCCATDRSGWPSRCPGTRWRAHRRS